MMKATELRIGNLIKLGGNTIDTYQTYKPVRVNLGILKGIAEENEERPEAVLSVYQPIPLTEEWLIKFGFRILNDCVVGYKLYLNSGHILTFLNEELFCYLDAMALDKIKYVHQLQNLYFALTGEELIIQADK